jgi:protein arginine kinase activator
MKCDVCSERVATVHLTEIVNKQKRELHLCEDCAREKGVSVKPMLMGVEVTSQSISHPPMVSKTKIVLHADKLAGVSCPVCGTTFAEFRSSGRLGCPNDYMAFKRGLVPILDKIHGHVEHTGKVPAHMSERLQRHREVTKLRKELNEAIQQEEYERAAELRDRIYELEER